MYKSAFKEKSIPNIKSVAKKVEMQANKNDHTGSLLTIAKAINDKYFENLLILVSKITKIEGNIPPEIYDYRLTLHKELMKEVGRNYPEAYPILQQALGSRNSYKPYSDDDLPF